MYGRVFVWTRVRVCTHYSCVYTWVFIHTCIRTCVSVRIYKHVCVFVYIRVCPRPKTTVIEV